MVPTGAGDFGESSFHYWHRPAFLLVVNIVYAFFDTFGIIQNVTQGGPARTTEILVYKVWYDGVVALDLGGSAAQSVILMAIVIALTAIQFRFVERRVHYG
jgi:sn-glycerol 3-phosphate transport system permease protein